MCSARQRGSFAEVPLHAESGLHWSVTTLDVALSATNEGSCECTSHG